MVWTGESDGTPEGRTARRRPAWSTACLAIGLLLGACASTEQWWSERPAFETTDVAGEAVPLAQCVHVQLTGTWSGAKIVADPVNGQARIYWGIGGLVSEGGRVWQAEFRQAGPYVSIVRKAGKSLVADRQFPEEDFDRALAACCSGRAPG